jgi:hypothetical protein
MFLAKGLGVHTITSAGNVETAAGARYALPIQRWTLGANITGNLNFPNQNNHKNIQLDVGAYHIKSNNASSAITYSDTDSTVLKIKGSGNISAGQTDASGNPQTMSVYRQYAHDIFASAFNSTDTGALPAVTSATKSGNAVFTFASDVRAGAGTNGTLSTSPPNNVFRIAFRGPEDDMGDWCRTLFTATSISSDGLTVTTNNNTTGNDFYTWQAYNNALMPHSYGATYENTMYFNGTQTRVGTVSMAPENDRFARGTRHGHQATNSANSRSIYGGNEYVFDDTRIAGGPNGGSTATDDILGDDWHILTLRPGRWYNFQAFISYREHSRPGYYFATGRYSNSRWQVSGIPSSTMYGKFTAMHPYTSTIFSENWSVSPSSPLGGGDNYRKFWPSDGDRLYLHGYVNQTTLISISGESENNVRSGMEPSGGGPKTPFMGGYDIASAGTTYYPATNNGYPYSPDYKAFDGSGVITTTDGTVTGGIDLSQYTGQYSKTGMVI